MRGRSLFTVLIFMAIGGVLSAHHSISAVYDTRQPVSVEGVITEFHFVNPHPYLVIEGKEAGGEAQPWHMEMDNLGELVAVGVTKDTLRPGDRVTVTGSRSRSKRQSLYVRKLVRSGDGFEYEQVGSSPRVKRP